MVAVMVMVPVAVMAVMGHAGRVGSLPLFRHINYALHGSRMCGPPPVCQRFSPVCSWPFAAALGAFLNVSSTAATFDGRSMALLSQ